MIRVFTIRQPLVILLLILVVFVLRLPSLLDPSIAVHDAGAYTCFEELFRWINTNPVWTYVGGSVLIILQALHLNFIFEKHDAQNKITFLPALFYVIYSSLFSELDSQILPALVAQTPLMIALDNYFGLYKSNRVREKIFNAMVFLGIGILLYTPMAFLIIVFLASLFFVKIPGVRDFFMVIAGALLPLYFGFVYCYVTDTSAFYLTKLQRPFYWNNIFVLEQHQGERLLLGFLGLLFIFASYKLYSHYFKNIIKTRIIQQMLFVLALVSLLALAVFFHLQYQHLLIFIIPFAYSFSYYFMGKWRFWLNEIVALILVIAILAIKFYRL